MIEVYQAQTIYGGKEDRFIDSEEEISLDASELVLLPALIDPHVHFRTPGAEHKENWESGAKAAIAGGVTTVLDMPNNQPACTTAERLEEKTELIERQLRAVHIPLRYGLYLGADRYHLDQIGAAKEKIVGLKIYMGSSTGNLLMNDRGCLEEAFQVAAEHDVLVAVHAEDEELIQLQRNKLSTRKDAAVHSEIRNPTVAARAVEMAIELTKRYGGRLYVVHTSTKQELDLIRQAKKEGIAVYAEASPHHLFLNTTEYETLGTKALVNPPLREQQDREALWEAIHDETIDTIGTDHAPHTAKEKMEPYGSAPSGFPSIELYLSLLLNAYHQNLLSLEQIVRLTHTGPRDLFRLSPNDDFVLVDLNKEKVVDDHHLKTRAKWSPYKGWKLKGWPRYTLLKHKLFDLEKL